MPGTANVTIGENQWNVEVASTYSELISGLSGRASLAAGTGMLFILPARQAVTVQTNQMLFPLDIIFIKDDLVLDVVRNVGPGNIVTEATPCDSFLELNAGEAALVGVGAAVDVELLYTIQAPNFDIDPFIAFVAFVVIGSLAVVAISGRKGPSDEHHSIHGPERDRLVGMYGSWAVGRAESVCPMDDVQCVEHEAAQFLTKFKAGRWG